MEAEGALYSQTPKLIEFLAGWSHADRRLSRLSSHSKKGDSNRRVGGGGDTSGIVSGEGSGGGSGGSGVTGREGGGGGGTRRALRMRNHERIKRALAPHVTALVGSGKDDNEDDNEEDNEEEEEERVVARRTASAHGSDSLPSRMQLLYADLYERGYIELNDVFAAQMWLRALADSGFDFPPVVV